MKIADLLSPELIKLPLERNEKQDVIAELVDLLAANQKVKDPDSAFKAIYSIKMTFR